MEETRSRIKNEILRLQEQKEKALRTKLSSTAQACIKSLEEAQSKALASRNLKDFTALAHTLIQGHKKSTIKMLDSEWKVIWGIYNKSKNNILTELSNKTQGTDVKEQQRKAAG